MKCISSCSATSIAMLCAYLCACAGGSETGNPVVETSISLSVRSSEPEVIVIDSTGPGAVLDEAWFAFGEVGFLDDAACANFGEIDVPGASQLIVDLARANAHFTLEVAPGSYCGMVVPLPLDNARLPDGAPVELENHSIVLKGTRADGTPFVLTHPEHDEIELAAEQGDIEVGAQGFVLSFDVAQLMQGVDLDGAEVDDDGTLYISGTMNRAQLDRFEVNLECALELHSDANADGVLDPEDPLLARCIPE